MKNKIILILFFLVITTAAVTIFVLPADNKSVYSENRVPATLMPVTEENISSGKLTSNFEDYLGDNIGLRSHLTKASAWIEGNKGYDSELGKIVSTNKDIGTAVIQKSSLLIVNNTVMEMFLKNRDAEESYINTINYYDEVLDGIKVYSMIIPTQLEFQEKMYSNIEDSQKQTIDYIYSKLNDNITCVDTYSLLKENKDKYIYFRTDHHWTALGAYYGYCSFLKAASGDKDWKMNDSEPDSDNDPFTITEYENINIKGFEKNKVDNFLGFLYKQSKKPEIAWSPDVIEWYNTNEDKKVTVENSGMDNGRKVDYDGTLFDEDKKNYALFMSGDQPLSVITNKRNPDGKTIMIMKDSYANALTPWLINNYHRIVLVDPRNCTDSLRDIIDKYTPDECLIMNYIFTTTFEDYAQMMVDMIK